MSKHDDMIEIIPWLALASIWVVIGFIVFSWDMWVGWKILIMLGVIWASGVIGGAIKS